MSSFLDIYWHSSFTVTLKNIVIQRQKFPLLYFSQYFAKNRQRYKKLLKKRQHCGCIPLKEIETIYIYCLCYFLSDSILIKKQFINLLTRAQGITLPLQESNLNFFIFSLINLFGNVFFTFLRRFPDVFATSKQGHFGSLVTCVSIENLP